MSAGSYIEESEKATEKNRLILELAKELAELHISDMNESGVIARRIIQLVKNDS
jgi:hypothetical protein